MKETLLQLPGHVLVLVLRRLLPRMGDLEKENLFLRYQLLVLKRQVGRAQPNQADRSVLATLVLAMNRWRDACVLVKPETLLSWQRRLAVRWTWTRIKPGRKPVARDIRNLVVRMKRENRLWGAKRIHGELMKLGIEVSETSVRNILRRVTLGPDSPQSSGTWREFIKRHQTVWATDFFTVHSATLRRLYVLVLMDIKTRELLSVRVTAHPTAEWVNQVIQGELIERDAPAGIIMDRDPGFEAATVGRTLKQRDILQLRCPRKSPLANSRVERLNGTLQRECTDHFLFFTERQLERTLQEYMKYYNEERCHQALEQKSPKKLDRRPLRNPLDTRAISCSSFLGGLHHSYTAVTSRKICYHLQC